MICLDPSSATKGKRNHFCRNQNENLGKNLFEWDLAPELRGQNYDIYSKNIAKANKTFTCLGVQNTELKVRKLKMFDLNFCMQASSGFLTHHIL